MKTQKRVLLFRKFYNTFTLLLLVVFTFGMGGFTVRAQTMANDLSTQVGGYIVSNGQFVYGPNVGDFNLKDYLHDHAPHLIDHADDLYARSEYFSINPKVYLTLLELHNGLISNPDMNSLEDPFGLDGTGFIVQIEKISEAMFDAYYLHLYTYSVLPASERNLPPFVTSSGEVMNVESQTNAGTYAVIAALARTENQQRISQILDNNNPNGFYRTYTRLFLNDNPLDEQNYIHIPGLSILRDPRQVIEPMGAGSLVPPDNLLQFPFARGQSWKFGGVHDNSGGGGVGSPLNDASSMDFYPNGLPWDSDTSNMWVVASASGVPTKVSACYFKIVHVDGWETTYYHLENIQNYSGSINQNDPIGVIANTLAEATCSGGSATGPHVHFTLRKNGALVAINGTALSGWYVHTGRWNYDTDKNYMWLEKSGIKKYAYSDYMLSEAPVVWFAVSGNVGVAGAILNYVEGSAKIVTANENGEYTILVPSDWSGTITPFKPGYAFTPVNLSYATVQSDQIGQNYTAQQCGGCTDVNIIIGDNPSDGYSLLPSDTIFKDYSNLIDGPVKVICPNGNPCFTTQVVTSGGSYNELAGYPVNQFTTEYWFPYYDHGYPNVAGNKMRTWILVGNPSTTETAIVEIRIGGVLKNDPANPSNFFFSIPPGGNVTPRWLGLIGGPVQVKSTNGVNIFASERVFTVPYNSFNEVMGYPANQFTTEYWFPWYDTVYMDTYLLVGNTSITDPAIVDIYVGTTQYGPYTILPNSTLKQRYAGTVNGPVRVVSTNGVNIVASEFTLSGTENSFNEVMGYPFDQFDTEYWYPYYDHGYPNVAGNKMRTWILVGNPSSSQTATVQIYIDGVLKNDPANPSHNYFSIPPGGNVTPRWLGSVSGPVRVVSDIPIFTSERVFTVPTNAFNEFMGIPFSQFSTEYWFTWYDTVYMNTQVLISKP